ncbi:MAG: RtcB family protein [Candidatus Omnitrophica bacterium]|nr:RtcB family protein [Candidatus Omnitrophota bacterium]
MTQAFSGKFERINEYRWRIPKSYMQGMRVPGKIFSSEKMLKNIIQDNAPQQVANAAFLPGIVRESMAMPDIHWGYGLPIGGVVATDIDNGGVITPGGVGYDINCGIRLIRTSLAADEVRSRMKELVDALFHKVPTGVGSTGKIKVDYRGEEEILTKGAKWAVQKGYGWQSDLDHCEESGCIKGADPTKVSKRAYERGHDQSGTLGSGNHFLEVQVVDEIYHEDIAKAFGIEKGKITIMIHTGSRGLGHQVCGDYAQRMISLLSKFRIDIPDKQLSCVPVRSEEGEAYLGAMRSAANYAWANRQVITYLTREVFKEFFGESAESMGMDLVYDVAHNIAKIEKYELNGKMRTLCIHRKGATRAFPPAHPDLPQDYKKTGQPVIIPGDMGRCSYLLAGVQGAEETFFSTCHGAGRLLSRAAAIRATRGRSIAKELAEKGIFVRCDERETLHEEVSEAYKDVSEVVDVVHKAGLSEKIARMRPIGVIKG